jgi:short-subunit dehydrogenase
MRRFNIFKKVLANKIPFGYNQFCCCGTAITYRSERFEQLVEKYPSWPKGHPWKGCRSLIAARGFKSLLLRKKEVRLMPGFFVLFTSHDKGVSMLALITGASSGIGKAMAHYLADHGWDLILVSKNSDRLKRTCEELKEKGVRLTACAHDLSRREQCFRLYEEVRSRQIDLLINSAGTGVFGSFAETGLGDELLQIDLNVAAVHILTKLFLRDMLARDSGVILNVGSSAGFMAGPVFSGYYASKNYVVRLTEAIHEELKRRGSHVKISVLCPGPVRTDFDRAAGISHSMRGLDPETVAAFGIRNALKGRRTAVPGFSMKAGLFLSRLLPESLMLRITYRIQNRKNGR